MKAIVNRTTTDLNEIAKAIQEGRTVHVECEEEVSLKLEPCTWYIDVDGRCVYIYKIFSDTAYGYRIDSLGRPYFTEYNLDGTAKLYTHIPIKAEFKVE